MLTMLPDEEVKFQCSKCGICCRKAAELGVMPDRGDGACIHLDHNNLCTIYDTRPELCNLDRMYLKHKAELPALTKREYFKINSSICNAWMDEKNLPADMRIDLDKYDN